MLRETTVTADTIEEAKQKACQELGVDMEKAQFEVIRLPEKKMFGLFGGSPAEVRAFYEVTPLECAKEYLEEILKYMDIGDITVTAEEDENGAVITLDGEKVSYIIGHRGETLDALQYLTGLVANHVEQSYYRISINIGNYREKREKTLEILGRKLAFKALKTGQKTALEPMNPYERRIIHTAVQKVRGASSWSEGEELQRHVVIGPDPDFKPSYNKNRKSRSNNFNKDGSYNRRPRSAGYQRRQYAENETHPQDSVFSTFERESMNESPATSLYGRIDVKKPASEE